MSKFLAPIHTWLFNKIRISEAIEGRVVDAFRDMDMDFLEAMYQRIGMPLPEGNVEDFIDTSNIHGWLQEGISRTELRTAELITRITARIPDAEETLAGIWRESGILEGKRYAGVGAGSPETAYKLVQDVVLEGMPCDRVSQIVSSSERQVAWATTRCLHKEYFDRVGGDVRMYYHLRQAFINGFLTEASPGATYTIEAGNVGSGAEYINHITQQ